MARKAKATANELKSKLISEQKTPSDLRLSSGVRMLNFASSGTEEYAYIPGSYYLMVGASRSGKTFLCLQALAEASICSKFDKYTLVYDNVERGAHLSIGKFFGKGLADRLVSPSDRGASYTVEEFYYNLDDTLNKGPCIYVLDSTDSLTSDSEQKKFKENKSIHRRAVASGKEAEAKGSYGDGKAGKHSANLRHIIAKLDTTQSLLFIISQSRDNIGHDAVFNPQTRAGGRALTFFATIELWFSIKGKIRKNILGLDRVVGSKLMVQIKKNRVKGTERSVVIPYYPSFGTDDTGAGVEYLIEEGVWKATKEKLNDTKGMVDGMSWEEGIKTIEEAKDLKIDFWEIIGERWAKVEAACNIQRTFRYGEQVKEGE